MSPDEYEAKRADIAALTQTLHECVGLYNAKVAEVREELNGLYDAMIDATLSLSAAGGSINGRYGGASHMLGIVPGEPLFRLDEVALPYVEIRVTIGDADVD